MKAIAIEFCSFLTSSLEIVRLFRLGRLELIVSVAINNRLLLLNGCDGIIGIRATSFRCLQRRWNEWRSSSSKWIIHSWRLQIERTNYEFYWLLTMAIDHSVHKSCCCQCGVGHILILTNGWSNGLIASCCNDCCCGRCGKANWLLPRAIVGRANWNPWLPFGCTVNGLGDIWKKSCWREVDVCDCCYRFKWDKTNIWFVLVQCSKRIDELRL